MVLMRRLGFLASLVLFSALPLFGNPITTGSVSTTVAGYSCANGGGAGSCTISLGSSYFISENIFPSPEECDGLNCGPVAGTMSMSIPGFSAAGTFLLDGNGWLGTLFDDQPCINFIDVIWYGDLSITSFNGAEGAGTGSGSGSFILSCSYGGLTYLGAAVNFGMSVSSFTPSYPPGGPTPECPTFALVTTGLLGMLGMFLLRPNQV